MVYCNFAILYSQIIISAGIMFGGLLEKRRKLQLADINLAVTC